MSLEKSKAKVKKKRVPRKKAKTKVMVEVEAEQIDLSSDAGEDFFDEFVSAAKAIDDSIIVPEDENEPLLQVNTYIPMHEEFQKIIMAPGIPCGLIAEVYGHPDSGKTTFCIESLIQCQRAGGIPVLLLSELKFDLKRCVDMGLDIKRMVIKRPKTIEEVRENLHDIITAYEKSGGKVPICVVWDSMAATPCEKELNEKRGDFAGDNAAALTVLLRKTQAMIRDHKIAFMMINQISTKVGVTFGKKTQAKGGFAPKFYSALRIEFTKTGRIRAYGDAAGSDFCGIKTHVEVEKNHLGTPFKTADYQIDYKGFVFDRKVERKDGFKKVHTGEA